MSQSQTKARKLNVNSDLKKFHLKQINQRSPQGLVAGAKPLSGSMTKTEAFSERSGCFSTPRELNRVTTWFFALHCA